MYSRRDFGKIAIAGLPLSMALAEINSTFNGVQIGTQSYSFRDRSLDEAIQAMADIGIGECELYSGHVEPRPPSPRPQGGPPGGAERKAGGGQGRPPGGGRPRGGPEAEARRQELRKWRLTVPLDEFHAIRKKFDDAGIMLYAFNLSFRDDYTDEEIDRGFQMAKALGVKLITASSTVSAAKRVAPFADKHRMIVAMHGHSNIEDPNEFAKPESFAQANAMSKYFGVNLDIGHFFAAGFDPVSYLEKNHDRIHVLHIKDRKKDNGPNMPWGEGDTPIKEVLQLLKAKQYPIPANIEYEYRGEDTVAEVRKCFQYCKDALA
jgi:sugar phosphate isomerase/epimerase